ncbi:MULTISPECIES: gamma-glutamyl-gamma-aminobutyrate hydrolase family protein [Microtetraspora]|uniref:Gamma-glutamyl-gamma-aminobutyrate hydrolase family protein n=1 Tax=Microtetraspora glauca TaxID=1996 RepID=A0ABV3GDK8_MICGL|nr:gamma-glutamyl-gamma-aminobutyrate hydrolase family protein [Microtetraspora sp. AC03309]MCC5575062.1 gamma-glutamyl-gamma-aminobutyrate hydrolase family protein [Microtetraspora sp. AC03309]
MSRPVIGITCYVEPAKFTVWEMTAALLPYMYVERVSRAGGQPVILPPAGDPATVAGRLDGLIIAGGGDIDPARYGSPPHDQTGYIRKFRDEAEFRVLRAALDAGMPFLGVCRGMQVLNVARGGTLHQHLPDIVGHSGHSPAPGTFGRIPVRLSPTLAKIYEAEEVTPAHYHHQAIDRLGDGLAVTAHADDGTIEAVELDGHPFAHAVQWHPEADEHAPVFHALVTAAARAARARRR